MPFVNGIALCVLLTQFGIRPDVIMLSLNIHQHYKLGLYLGSLPLPEYFRHHQFLAVWTIFFGGFKGG